MKEYFDEALKRDLKAFALVILIVVLLLAALILVVSTVLTHLNNKVALNNVTPIVTLKEPVYLKKDAVFYKVPKFYIKVCSGVALVQEFDNTTGTYTVEVPTQDIFNACPRNFELKEAEILGLTDQ